MKKHLLLMTFCFVFARCFAEEKLIFTFNPNTNIFTAYVRSAQMVVVFDYLRDKSALFNGTSGAAFIFDFENRTGVYFDDESSNETWYSSQEKFDNYFLNMSTLNTLYNLGEKKGDSFDESSITAKLSKLLAQMFAPLSPEYADPCNSFPYFLLLCRINSKLLHTSLDSWSIVAGQINGEVRGDFKWLVQVFMGYGALFREFKCGMSLLADVGINLDFNEVLKEPTGIDSLNFFLKQLAPKLNIGHILGDALNSEQRFFQLVNGLGGNMTYDFDGFMNIISTIEDYIHGDCLLQEVLILLNAYYDNPKTDSEYVKKEWPRAIKDLLDTLQKFNLTESFKDLTKLLQDILGNQWMVGDNNMTKIVQEVLKIDPKSGMSAVTNVLTLLENIKFVKSF